MEIWNNRNNSNLLVLVTFLVAMLIVKQLNMRVRDMKTATIRITASGHEIPDGIRVGPNLRLLRSGIHVVGFSGRLLEKVNSSHVGYIEDFNRVEKMREVCSNLTRFEKEFDIVGIVTNGGTHKKPALTRIRDDLAQEIEFSIKKKSFSFANFFKKYDMGKFLSLDHGCGQPYLMLFDVRLGRKKVEKIGAIGSVIVFDLIRD